LPAHIKSQREVDGIRRAGRIVGRVLDLAGSAVEPGITLLELERICADRIRLDGGEPTFLGYRGFPNAVCISVNEEVVHGIPSSRRLGVGDIVKIDVGVTRDGFIADGARTFEVGPVAPEVHALVQGTEEAFRAGLAKCRRGNRVNDIGRAVQHAAESRGYSVVRELCGHGVGLELHEEPSVPNFRTPGRGTKLAAGMTLAVEPMVNMGGFEVETLANGWTVVAKDRRPSAHYEHTVLLTDGEPEILTNV
jgi:methionyl aminopeptidase